MTKVLAPLASIQPAAENKLTKKSGTPAGPWASYPRDAEEKEDEPPNAASERGATLRQFGGSADGGEEASHRGSPGQVPCLRGKIPDYATGVVGA